MISNLCDHGFTRGYCPEFCVAVQYREDVLRERRQELHRLGHRRRAKKDRVDKVSLILAYQNLRLAELYPNGVPDNLITPERFRAARGISC